MIAQGTDGLSRADHSQGVMQGKPIEDFIPLHLDPFDPESTLRGWIEAVTLGLTPKILTPEEWYCEGHELGTFVWTTPPVAAEVVVEQLGRARLKRPESMHLILVPRLMTGHWRRLLARGSDFYFRIDWKGVWDLSTHFEPLLVFVCLPYRSCSPKHGERDKLLDELRGKLLGPSMSETCPVRQRSILRKLLFRARALCPV